MKTVDGFCTLKKSVMVKLNGMRDKKMRSFCTLKKSVMVKRAGE